MTEMAAASFKSKLGNLINESIEELKKDSQDSISEEMEQVNKIVKEHDKEGETVKGDDGNYTINSSFPHKFQIVPKCQGIYDVLHYKDNTDRTKKLNLSLDELKDFIKEKFKSKDLNYTKSAYNKSADNSKDKVEKTDNPTPFKFTQKKVTDSKNDNKDYNEKAVTKEDDLPDKPLKTVEKFKKQSENPVKGTKPDYTYPKQKDKKLTIKPKAFKGKARKKD